MPASPTVQGPIGAVPCSHCGVSQNYTELEHIENGMEVECDECGKLSVIVAVRKVVVVRQV